ncbi:2-acylglycerophosphoethanolamine acyltransferase / Acyl-[acyl-carrier-protein] synthetase, partial [hydrothermal vent metagenome]
MLSSVLKAFFRILLRTLYRVEIHGKEHLKKMGQRTLVVSNHTSFLDAVLLYAFLPATTSFAINTAIANSWMGRVGSAFCDLFALDPANPLSIRSLIRRVKEGGCVVIFPEGRITVTGSLMKIYPGPGLVADKSKASLLPIRIEGAQYTPFSRLRGLIQLRWFPKITLSVLPPRSLYIEAQLRGRKRRNRAGRLLSDLMSELMFETSRRDQTLVDKLLEARKIHGGKHLVAEDINRTPLSYNALITKSLVLGRQLAKHTEDNETIGVLLPGTLATVATFWGLQITGRSPAMLNYTVGAKGMIS